MTTDRYHRAAHPIVVEALALARTWCAGYTIAGHSALAHATRVARTVSRHVPPNPELTAAALLHDSPEYAPAGLDLDATLTDRFGPEVPRVIRALEAEHHALAGGRRAAVPTGDPPVLQLSAADKIVSLATTIRNATAAPDPAAYWASRQPLLDQLPHLSSFHHEASGHLPPAIAQTLGAVIGQALEAARPAALPSPRGCLPGHTTTVA